MSRFLLIPAKGNGTESREITLPDGLVENRYAELYKKVSDQNKLRNLLLKLAKAEIGYDKDGFVKHKDGTLQGINFDDAVTDSCNGNFDIFYEPFYALLRRYNILF